MSLSGLLEKLKSSITMPSDELLDDNKYYNSKKNSEKTSLKSNLEEALSSRGTYGGKEEESNIENKPVRLMFVDAMSYEDGKKILGYLDQGYTVNFSLNRVINDPYNLATRIYDFVSGACYVKKAKLFQIGQSTAFVIVPAGVRYEGNAVDAIQNSVKIDNTNDTSRKPLNGFQDTPQIQNPYTQNNQNFNPNINIPSLDTNQYPYPQNDNNSYFRRN